MSGSLQYGWGCFRFSSWEGGPALHDTVCIFLAHLIAILPWGGHPPLTHREQDRPPCRIQCIPHRLVPLPDRHLHAIKHAHQFLQSHCYSTLLIPLTKPRTSDAAFRIFPYLHQGIDLSERYGISDHIGIIYRVQKCSLHNKCCCVCGCMVWSRAR